MVASAEVEYDGYCQWTRVQEIMEFARILRANGFEPYAVPMRRP